MQLPPKLKIPGGGAGWLCALGTVGAVGAVGVGEAGWIPQWWPAGLGLSLGLLAGGAVLLGHARRPARWGAAGVARGTLIDAAPEGIILHRSGQVLFGNPAVVRLLGHEHPQAIQEPATLAGQVAESERRRWLQHERDCMERPGEARQLEIPVRRPDGSLLWLASHSCAVPWADGPAVLSFFSDVSAARQAREALRASEVSYRSLFEANRRVLENSPAGIILVNRDLRVVYENPGVAALLRLPPDAATGSTGLPVDESALFRGSPAGRALKRLPSGRRIRLEAEWVAAEGGNRRWMVVEGMPIIEEEAFTGAVVLVTDITQRRCQEEALRLQERLLAALADVRRHLLSGPQLDGAIGQALDDLGRQSGVDQVLVFQNQPLQRRDLPLTLRFEWSGKATQRVLGSPAFTGLSYGVAGIGRWAERLAAGKSIRATTAGAPQDERDFLHSRGIQAALAAPIFAGAAFWGFLALVQRSRPRTWSDAEEAIYLAAAESLGQAIERNQTEARLRASEERFHELATNIPGMVFQFLLTADGSRSYPYVSRPGLEMLGLDGDLLRQDAEPLMGLIHPTDRIVFERLLRESARTMEPRRWEGRVYAAQGAQRWAAVMARPSALPNGDILWNGLLLDITRRKRVEMELIAAQQGHPLRGEGPTQAAAMRDALERLHEECEAARAAMAGRLSADWPAAADWEARLGLAVAAAGRVLRETAGPARPRPVTDLTALLREVIGVTLRGTDVIYRIELDGDLEPLAGDLETVRPVIHDLLIITLQALPEGGRVLLRAENIRVGPGHRTAGLGPGHYVRIILRDSGGGVDARSLRTPRAAVEGGAPEPSLAAVLETVTRQRGWLTIEPEAAGTTVTLYLRAAIDGLGGGVSHDTPLPEKARDEKAEWPAPQPGRDRLNN